MVAAPVALRLARYKLSVAILLVLGFASPLSARPLDPIDDVEMGSRLAELSQTPWAGQASEKSTGNLSSCTRSTITVEIVDPLTALPRGLDLDVIRPKKSDPVPVVVVVPTIEGPIVLERTIASKFCGMGIATIVADVNDTSQPEVLPSWGMEDQNNRRAIHALRNVFDYAAASGKFDRSKMGLMGLSLGAITSAMMAGVEDRVQGVFMVVGGANIPYILSFSNEDRVTELRERRMKHLGLSAPEQYEDELRRTVRFDPVYFAKRAKTDHLFMVLAKSDTKVPTPMQEALFDAFGRPENTVFSGGHVETIVGLTFFYFSYVDNFFRARFGMEPAPAWTLRSEESAPKPEWLEPPTSLPR